MNQQLFCSHEMKTRGVSSIGGPAIINTPAMSVPCMLSIKDVQYIAAGKSRSTIYRWIAEGKFPAPVKVCGSSMWPEESIAEWRNQVVHQVAGSINNER